MRDTHTMHPHPSTRACVYQRMRAQFRVSGTGRLESVQQINKNTSAASFALWRLISREKASRWLARTLLAAFTLL
jgi:hypothetical protein